MNWYEFADPDDKAAQRFYEQLLVQGVGYSLADHVWAKVPKKLTHLVYQGAYQDDPSFFWNGVEQVEVFTYLSGKGRLYMRLPAPGETKE